MTKVNLANININLILHKNKQVHYLPYQLVPKLRNERMQNFNLELKIRNFIFQILNI